VHLLLKTFFNFLFFAAVATLSGPGGSTLRTFDALTGQLLVEKRLHLPEIGILSEPVFIGKHVIFSPDSTDIYVLSNGYTVTNINSETGDVKWSWSSPDQRFF
jgi:ER membrane protein complex subunit 1